jgi:hypothetical protein
LGPRTWVSWQRKASEKANHPKIEKAGSAGTEIRKFEISCEYPLGPILRKHLMDRYKRRTARFGRPICLSNLFFHKNRKLEGTMWIRIRAVIIEDEPLAAQYLAGLLDDTCQVEVVGTAAESEVGLRLCA